MDPRSNRRPLLSLYCGLVLLGLSALALSEPSALAVPTDFAFESIPSRFQSRELTAGSRALGELCLSLGSMPDGTVCNPAFLPEAPGSGVLGRLFLGNGYAAVATANSFVYEPISSEFLQSMFQKQNVTSLEAHIGLVFTTPYFSASFSPYRVQYASEVHNPNLPVLAISAAVERSFALSTGMPLSSLGVDAAGFSLGARIRLLERDYVHGSFSLFKAIGENPRDFLPTQEQKAAYLDTFVGWKQENHAWQPRASLALLNAGRAWPDEALYPDTMDFALGFGVSPPLPFGKLRIGIDIVDLLHGSDFFGRTRFGAAYGFGMLEAMTGLTSKATTLGILFGFQFFKAGVVYEFHRFDFIGESNKRIATEMAISL